MPALASDLRRTLENTVVKARELAERGARDALTALAVGASEPFASMSEEERKLRNRLRAHGRQLGDQRDPQKGSQSIERLVREMAYEHWHRMLFARFLAENQLLIEPSSGVSISLDECEELAAEEGTDLWGLAAQFAQEMLPQIFRVDDPVLAAKLPLEIRQQLQGLVAGLAEEVFTASDSLGWTYQYWQSTAKEAVNKSGVKIGADELSPVTQLFTEAYMVDYLLDNTLGAWHAGKMLASNPQLAETAQSEEELRKAVALPSCPWAYLRFIQTDEGTWTPAAGVFEGWPKTARELKCLDPCMGSGHFVVGIFERMTALRLAEKHQNEAAATAAVIHDNLFGLEIDARCTQIAAFNLALTAWRRVGYCKLPLMNLACSGFAPNTSEDKWISLAGENERLRNGMARLYQLFANAQVLGSLINPEMGESDLLAAGFQEVQPLLEQALAHEVTDDTSRELVVAARGLAEAGKILSTRFTLVATNVPYLGRGKQLNALRSYCDSEHPDARADLATCFVERCLKFCDPAGATALVTPQNWLFLTSYQKLRTKILRQHDWNLVAKLGPAAFKDMNFWAATTCLTVVSLRSPSAQSKIVGFDASDTRDPELKGSLLMLNKPTTALQHSQLSNPDARVTISQKDQGELLSMYANSIEGLSTGDSDRYILKFWELPAKNKNWEWFIQNVNNSTFYGGRTDLVRWEGGKGDLHSSPTAHNFPGEVMNGRRVLGMPGIRLTQMRNLPCTLYSGELFGKSAATIVPHDQKNLLAIWAFCSSDEYLQSVRAIDPKANVTNATLAKVHFDLSTWQEIAQKKYPLGLPKPSSPDPVQWVYSGHPASGEHPLHVAIARLIGYSWPAENDTSLELSDEAREWTTRCRALSSLADNDGIVCLPSVRGEPAAHERLSKLLVASLGENWSSSKERELLLATAVANNGRKPEANLASWLRNAFFSEHCKLFQSRPFVWQVWDGNPTGFSALVNAHKLSADNGQGRKTLELLTFTYLGDWINRQKLDQSEGVNGADDRLAAALDLQGQLKKILEGEPPYDIFVRWKPLYQQAIGWDPDINDGVRFNIRPFLNAQLRKGGKAGAGILRAKPGTIKWAKDRGKEPMRSKEDFPWFWGWEENNPAVATDFGAPIPGAPSAGDSFDGNRWNDLHYTRAAKEAARARHRGEG